MSANTQNAQSDQPRDTKTRCDRLCTAKPQSYGALWRSRDWPQYLSTATAARFLDTSQHTLLSWRQRGVGPEWIKIGHLVRYPLQSLRAWVEARRRKPEPGEEG